MSFDFDTLSMESASMTGNALEKPPNHSGFREKRTLVPHYLTEGVKRE
jgi:hypothetical protein